MLCPCFWSLEGVLGKKMTIIVCVGSAGLFGYLIFLWAYGSFQSAEIAVGMAMVFAGVIGYAMTKLTAEIDEATKKEGKNDSPDPKA